MKIKISNTFKNRSGTSDGFREGALEAIAPIPKDFFRFFSNKEGPKMSR